jgi:hypothetical protein
MKFKELLLREEPRQGGWSLFAPVIARYRFVFGSSSARYWSSVWAVVLRYIGHCFALVLGARLEDIGS